MSPGIWTLAEIERATGIPLETLRYVLDTRVVSQLHAATGTARWQYGRGAARKFNRLEAFAIALAARMLLGGIQRSVVVQCLNTLINSPLHSTVSSDPTLLEQALTRHEISAIAICEPGHAGLIRSEKGHSDPEQWMKFGMFLPIKTPFSPAVRFHVEIIDLRQALDISAPSAKVAK
jgi:hypothetical protein